ncbi:hypothetical protein ABT369_49430 [Dactylosporangium sp. NPDC000244]|uniref:hypothetical protein n=1 Tax=Dactylosporangium sp. NPDC000244 TaxID=3154365 RepID=UPI003326478B
MIEADADRFATLFHALGRAVDTPGHLAALVGADADRRRAALGHLRNKVIHQGIPLTATAPAAATVAGLVHDPRLSGAANADLRAGLVDFLADVATAGRSYSDAWLDAWRDALAPPPGFDADAALAAVLASGDDYSEVYADSPLSYALFRRGVLGCREVTPLLLTVAVAALSDPASAVRVQAARAVAACGAGLADPAPLERQLAARVAEAGPDERAAMVLAIGEVGGAPRAHLRDPHPGVRACAALAPALADDPAALDEILAALADPLAPETWFAEPPPQFDQHIRFTLIAAATARTDDPQRLLPAALAVAPVASRHTAAFDVGPFLRPFFAGREPGPLSPVQRRFLTALADNDEVWTPGLGAVNRAFREVGLPYDRGECRDLADG